MADDISLMAVIGNFGEKMDLLNMIVIQRLNVSHGWRIGQE